MRVSKLQFVCAILGVSALSAVIAQGTKPPADQPGMECIVATKPYKGNEHGLFALPQGLKWQVMPRYVGVTETGQRQIDDRLTLVLVDEKNRFWPVIAKMPLEEAEKLQQDLAKMIEQKKAASK